MRDFVKELKRSDDSKFGGGFFDRIDAGKFSVSIQASDIHYSTPRKLLPDADGYSDFEVAIFEGRKWVFPVRDARFKDKPWADLFEDSNFNTVAGHVPRETVAQILADLEAVSP